MTTELWIRWLRHLSMALTMIGATVLVGCGNPQAKPQAQQRATDFGPGADVELTVDGDHFNTGRVQSRAGFTQLRVLNPSTSSAAHGIAIRGGTVSGKKIQIVGKTVRPGRATSLALKLEPGLYTITDPAGGARATLIVDPR